MRLLPLMLLAVCCSVRADWTLIAWADAGAFWEYEPERVKRNGTRVSFWIKQSGQLVKEQGLQKYEERPDLFSKREKAKYETDFAFGLVRWEIDCKKWEMRTLDGQDYDTNGAPFGTKVTQGDFVDIYPGSLMEVTAIELCTVKRK